MSVRSIHLLGYEVSGEIIEPHLENIEPLCQMPPPTNKKEQQRALGLSAYYSQWIPCFPDKIVAFVRNFVFPLPIHVRESFGTIKQDLANAMIDTIDQDIPLVIETDASDVALASTLSQNGHPVAFVLRTLSAPVRRYPAIEKEASAFVEAFGDIT